MKRDVRKLRWLKTIKYKKWLRSVTYQVAKQWASYPGLTVNGVPLVGISEHKQGNVKQDWRQVVDEVFAREKKRFFALLNEQIGRDGMLIIGQYRAAKTLIDRNQWNVLQVTWCNDECWERMWDCIPKQRYSSYTELVIGQSMKLAGGSKTSYTHKERR